MATLDKEASKEEKKPTVYEIIQNSYKHCIEQAEKVDEIFKGKPFTRNQFVKRTNYNHPTAEKFINQLAGFGLIEAKQVKGGKKGRWEYSMVMGKGERKRRVGAIVEQYKEQAKYFEGLANDLSKVHEVIEITSLKGNLLKNKSLPKE